MALTMSLSPIDQLVSFERVVHPHVVGIVEGESQRGAHLGQAGA